MCHCPKTYGPDCSLFHKPEHDNPRIVWEVLFNKKPPQKTRYSLDIIFWHKLPVHRKCSSPLLQHIAIKLIETHCAVLAWLFSVQWLSGASVPYLWLIFAGVWIQASKWWCKLCSLERKKERKKRTESKYMDLSLHPVKIYSAQSPTSLEVISLFLVVAICWNCVANSSPCTKTSSVSHPRWGPISNEIFS